MSQALTSVRDRYTDQQVEAFYRSGYWQEASFGELVAQQARTRGAQQFVFDSSTSLTYADFLDRTVRMAVGFKRAGIGKGDRVAVQLPNWTEFPVVAGALSRIGAITVPIMPIYRDDEVGFVLEHSGAVAAVTCEQFRGFGHGRMFEALAADLPALKTLYVARPGGPVEGDAVRDLSSLLVEGELAALQDEAGEQVSPDDGFLIVYTSGTTSRPKGCFHTFNTVRASATAIMASLDYTDQDVQFGPSPITHSTGLLTSVVMPLVAGARSYLMEAWEPQEGLRRIEQHGCTVAVTATAFLQMLMGAYDPAMHDASSMRVWVCAGSPIPGAIVERSRALLGCRTLSLYGRSENFLTTMCTLQDPPERSASSDGSALMGAEVTLLDELGEPVAVGQEGDIAYRGPSHMIEYFGDPEQTSMLWTSDGFSRSGDLGRADASGYIRVTGRLKDIIIRGGMNISAREVEEHLLQHPSIAAAAVVGMPDDRLGERVCAYVVLVDGVADLQLDEVAAYLKAHKVAVQKLPERLELAGALPMTATGKVQKHLLRADVKAKVG